MNVDHDVLLPWTTYIEPLNRTNVYNLLPNFTIYTTQIIVTIYTTTLALVLEIII